MKKLVPFVVFTLCLVVFACQKNDDKQYNSILEAVKELKDQNDSLLSIVKRLRERSDSIMIAINTNNQNLSAINARIDSVNSQLILVLTQIDSLNILLLQTNVDIASIKEEIIKLQEKCAELSALILQLHNQTINLSTGLLAYYPFSGNAGDSSGNGNHGTVNGATLTTDRFGTPNRAYKFGTTKNIDVLNPSTALNLLGSFTISSWFNLDSMASIYNGSLILSKNAAVGNDGWIYGIWNTNNDPISQVVNFQGNNNFNASTYPGSNGIVLTNAWHHFVTTYNSADQIFTYWLDGVIISTKTLAFNIISNNSDITIGYQKNEAYRDYFRGTIDEIRIYDRVLNSQEILELFAQ